MRISPGELSTAYPCAVLASRGIFGQRAEN